ncbi:hypothetical protein EDB19DRAFT_1827484 [Suillus lakei]|nr:hypothetical protein EDB19DRAFT_1827484 [Suillus lakei]
MDLTPLEVNGRPCPYGWKATSLPSLPPYKCEAVCEHRAFNGYFWGVLLITSAMHGCISLIRFFVIAEVEGNRGKFMTLFRSVPPPRRQRNSVTSYPMGPRFNILCISIINSDRGIGVQTYRTAALAFCADDQLSHSQLSDDMFTGIYKLTSVARPGRYVSLVDGKIVGHSEESKLMIEFTTFHEGELATFQAVRNGEVCDEYIYFDCKLPFSIEIETTDQAWTLSLWDDSENSPIESQSNTRSTQQLWMFEKADRDPKQRPLHSAVMDVLNGVGEINQSLVFL